MQMIPQWQLDKVLAALYEPLPPKPPKLVIEAKAARDVGGIKRVYHFDESLEALKARGYERHLRPIEAFSLLEKNLEGKLSEEEQEIAEDMLDFAGEWVSLAWEKRGDVLVAYLDPVGLVWDRGKYVKRDFSCSEERQFDITGKDSQSFLYLKKFPEDFVTWHYGRKFTELPEEMREGSNIASVRLPADGIIWPVSLGYITGGKYDVTAFFSHGVSRGVKHL